MFFLNGALFGIWAARIPAFQLKFGFDAATLGLLLLCLAAGAIVSFPLAGVVSDRVGAARLTRLVAQAYVLALVLLPFATTPIMLGLALAFFGMTHGAMDVAMNGWGAEVEHRLGKPIMSSLHAVFSLGAGLGAASGALAIAAGMDVALHFWLFGIVLGAGALSLAAISWPRAAPKPGDAAFFTFPHGMLVIVGLIAFCASMGEGAMADWSAVFLKDVTGTTEARAALGYAAFSTSMVAMRLFGDRVVARFGPAKSLRMSGAVAASGLALVLAGGGFELALAGFALIGLGYANVMPIAFSRAANDLLMPPGRAIAAVATLGYGGMLVGPPAIGFIAALSSLHVSFALLGLLALAVTALAGSVTRRQQD